MKRDIDLLRNIMLMLEKNPPPQGARIQIPGVEEVLIAHHIKLLTDNGWIEAKVLESAGTEFRYVGAMFTRITTFGYDFITLVRDDASWNEAKHYVIDQHGDSWSLPILLEFLSRRAHRKILLAP